MILKNIYLFCPAGYSGSYVSWAISKSDVDKANSLPDDPINKIDSAKYGSKGTVHLADRIPTHQGFEKSLAWIIYNKPVAPVIHLINYSRQRDKLEHFVRLINEFDPTGIIINIHDDQDFMNRAFGHINNVIKWPTFMAACGFAEEFGVDPFNCSADINFRNTIVKLPDRLYHGGKIRQHELQRTLTTHQNWYNIRNRYQPHEVNETYYSAKFDLTNRIFELSNYDIITDSFPEFILQFLQTSGISDNYDVNHLRKIHPTYVGSQQNLQWFSSIRDWEETGIVDDYLRSHSIIHAELIMHIFRKCGATPRLPQDRDNWILFYVAHSQPHWPNIQYFTNEQDFYKLPEQVQQELTQHGFLAPDKQMIDFSGWEEMTIDEINAHYQYNK